MKKHPNRKRVSRKIANVMRWHYFGCRLYRVNRLSARRIYSYILEDANGRYF